MLFFFGEGSEHMKCCFKLYMRGPVTNRIRLAPVIHSWYEEYK